MNCLAQAKHENRFFFQVTQKHWETGTPIFRKGRTNQLRSRGCDKLRVMLLSLFYASRITPIRLLPVRTTDAGSGT
jgi:hypothetical protein